ncbi:hypothetical protein K469DRAFT_76056 [Zopfia rhizophila CBS 207.26]|uniref:Uncharacterized protein n=1 Tax=Zopfia rhizophila CBS 207.26 TaxID=1314779 RepID=A0A6A6EAR8_9PEZI|nr:hypothetical protein K469DRAFT_76056 [Zopfia rhizophila CBS 207.26]
MQPTTTLGQSSTPWTLLCEWKIVLTSLYRLLRMYSRYIIIIPTSPNYHPSNRLGSHILDRRAGLLRHYDSPCTHILTSLYISLFVVGRLAFWICLQWILPQRPLKF